MYKQRKHERSRDRSSMVECHNPLTATLVPEQLYKECFTNDLLQLLSQSNDSLSILTQHRQMHQQRHSKQSCAKVKLLPQNTHTL